MGFVRPPCDCIYCSDQFEPQAELDFNQIADYVAEGGLFSDDDE